MNDKMNDPECVTRKVKISPHDYSKENFLDTFTPQKQLTPEQIFWSNDLMKLESEALKERTKVSRPIKAFTVFPPNTPATLVPKVLPTKNVFEELEAEVAQYAVDRKRDAIELKNLLIANDNLIAECLSQEVFCVATNSKLNVARFTEMHVANTTAEARCLALEADLANLPSLQGKDNVIRQLKNQLSQLQVTRSDTDRTPKVQTTDSQITKLTARVTHLQAQNDLFRAENDKIKQHYKELYDSIKITRTKHIEQVTKLTVKNVNLKSSVKEAKVVRPLDRSVVSVCRYTKHSQELLEYAIGTCPQGSQQRAKQLAHIPLIRRKQVIVSKPSDKSDSTTHRHVVTVKSQKTNVHVPPSTGVNSFPNASGSQPKSHVKPNRISPAKGVNKLPVDDQPRTNKSYLRTSNRVNSSSRLKRTDLCVATCLQSVVATPSIRHNCNVVRKVVQIVLWYLDSGCSKHMTEDRSRLMNFVKKFIGTVRFENDHFGAIMCYGDYVIGNSVIYRVYYVEGLGHNLFSVGQFCDSHLEVAFQKHSCYVRDIDGVELIKGSRGSN
nr:integrase, catalytic region, zinc finger, CCHC-type, peptidase aspartic, catalytic [Tanacetum cinerariifolium]